MNRIRHIDNFDMVNTFRGVAVSVWFQGCSWRCEGCFNPETWKLAAEPITDEDISKVIYELTNGINKDLSILGGDPFHPSNRDCLYQLITEVKSAIPDVKIYLWTGYLLEDIRHLPHLDYLDVVVDGKFKQELKCEGMKYGSTNQRIHYLK